MAKFSAKCGKNMKNFSNGGYLRPKLIRFFNIIFNNNIIIRE